VSSYATPDSFGSAPGLPVATDPTTGLTYVLGFNDATHPPTPVWQLASTWARAKILLGPSWAHAKQRAPTWGIAKALGV
jgi:hypothetical protein